MNRNERRTQRRTGRTELAKAKAQKRKWLVILILVVVAIGGALWSMFR